FAIKSQSIDVTQKPKKTYIEVVNQLENAKFKTIQTILLDPFDKDHMFWHGVWH
ncbi:MAG: fibrillarin-like rRNA/tRNA 2'-O-methyltransferase, partial [Candidatus Micrarchaeota archaeon]